MSKNSRRKSQKSHELAGPTVASVPISTFPYRCFCMINYTTILTQWDKSGRSVTGSTVSDGSVCDGELTQVVANHLGLNLNIVEHLTVVDTNDGTDHLGNDDHVSQVGLDNSGLLVLRSSQLGGSQLGNETHRLGAQTTRKSSSDTGTAELDELLVVELQQFGKVHAFEGEGLEGSLPGSWEVSILGYCAVEIERFAREKAWEMSCGLSCGRSLE